MIGFFNLNAYFRLLISSEIINNQEVPRIYRIYSINKKEKAKGYPTTHVCSLEDKSQHNQAQECSREREREI